MIPIQTSHPLTEAQSFFIMLLLVKSYVQQTFIVALAEKINYTT